MDEIQLLDSDTGLSKGLRMGIHCRGRRRVWGRVWVEPGEMKRGGNGWWIDRSRACDLGRKRRQVGKLCQVRMALVGRCRPSKVTQMVEVKVKTRTQDIRQLWTWPISWHLWQSDFLTATNGNHAGQYEQEGCSSKEWIRESRGPGDSGQGWESNGRTGCEDTNSFPTEY